MIKTEFGIIDNFQPDQKYTAYETEKYQCVAINDECIDDWWERLLMIRTYNIYSDDRLEKFADLIQQAITENKYMIHYGV